MYRKYQSVVWGLIAVVLTVGLAGCGFFGDSNLNPTSPGSQGPHVVTRDIAPVKFSVFKAFGQFGVAVPQGGTYLLNYTTRIGTFQVVFQSPDAATLPIGLQRGDDVIEASVQQGTVPSTTPVVQQIGTIAVFATPGIGIPFAVSNTFVVNPLSVKIVLVQNGQVVSSDLVENADENDESTQFGIFQDVGSFDVYVPTGEYVVTYTTKSGTFQLALRAYYGNFLTIGLNPGDQLLNVSVQQGSILTGTPVLQKGTDGIVLFAMPGSIIAWNAIFLSNPLVPQVTLVQNGNIVVNLTVIIFTKDKRHEFKTKKHHPKGKAWGYWAKYSEFEVED